MIKPTKENLEDPYVLQLIETISMLEEERTLTKDYCHECYRLKTRIKELEEGACRFNCRDRKAAFEAGWLAAQNVWHPLDVGKEYRRWLKEQREKEHPSRP